MKPWVLLFLSVIANSGANFLLLNAAALRHTDIWRYSVYLLLTISVLGLSLWCYERTLRQLPLNVAYPVLTGGAVILVAMVEHLSAGSAENLLVGGGIGCVVAGIAVLGAAKRRSPPPPPGRAMRHLGVVESE